MSFWENLGDFLGWGNASRQREFSSAEAEKARQFSSNEADIARQFSSNEAEIARQFNSAEALKQREFSSLEAQKVRDWDTEISNSAHQREIADLKAAGINPILTANNGASTPTAGAAQGIAAFSNSAGTTMAQTSKADGQMSYGGLSNLVSSASSLINALKKAEKNDAKNAIKTISTLTKFLR